MDKKYIGLLGAMIGLVRAAEKNGKTEDTDRVLLEGLRTIRHGGEAEPLLSRVREEKAKAAPNCAHCAMPCGSTADADMEALEAADARCAVIRYRILSELLRAADRLLPAVKAGIDDPEAMYLLHKGLFYVGEDADEMTLRAVHEEVLALRASS